MKLNLSSKLIGSFSIVLLLTVVVGLMGTYTSQTIRDRLDYIIEKDVKPANILGDVARRVGFIRANSLLHLLTSSIDDMNRYESEVADWIDKINSDLNTLENTFEDQATLDKLAEFRTAWETYLRVWREQVLPLSRAKRDEEAFTLARKSGAGGMAAREAMYKLDELHHVNIAAANHRLKLANQDFRKSQYILSAAILLAIILGLAFGIKQSSLIAGAVNTVSKAAQLMATGDLDQRVVIKTGDEIESMADSFNTMTVKLKTMVEELQHEITERQRVEEELKKHREHLEELVKERTVSLQKSEEKYRNLFQQSNDAIFIHDLENNIIEVNQKAVELFGYTYEEFSSLKLSEFRGPGMDEQVLYANEKIAQDGFVSFEFDFRKKNGEILSAEVSSCTFDIAGEKVVHAIIRDITKRKQAEEDMRISEERFRSFVQCSGEGIYLFEFDKPLRTDLPVDEQIKSLYKYGYIAECNDQLAHMYGFSRGEEIVGKRLIDFHGSDDNPENIEFLRSFIRSGYRIMNATSEEFDKDGNLKYISNNIIGIVKKGVLLRIWASQQDITERKQAEEELKKYREHLEELVKKRTNELEKKTVDLEQANIRLLEVDRLKSVFLANMSHELRTPLNSIIGFTGLLLMGMAGELNAEQKKQLSLVKNSANHLLSLINDILDISKIEAGKVALLIEEFCLNDVVEDVIKIVSPLVNKKGLKITQEVPEGIKIISDKRRVKQVLMNYISNAVKFTDQGSIKIKVGILDSNIELCVSDTGIGMKKEDMKKLFKPFQQIDMSSTKQYEGTGLGLYLCKKMVSLMGGDVSVKSKYGKGSEFAFILPVNYKKE